MRTLTVIGLVLGGVTVGYLGRHYIEDIIDAARNKKNDLPETVEDMIEEAVDTTQGAVETVKEEIKEEIDSHGEETPAPPAPKKGTSKKK